MRNMDHIPKTKFRTPKIIRRAFFLFILIAGASAGSIQTFAAPLFKVLVVGLPDVNHPTTGAAGNKAVQEIAVGQNYTVDICTDYTLISDAYLAPYQVMVW